VDDSIAAGLRLKAAREAAGISQRRLAFPGCSAAYISRVEAGTRIASRPILRGLAERLGVTEAYLCSGGSVIAQSALDDAEIALRLDQTDEAARLFEAALMDGGSDAERARAFEGLGQLAHRAGNPQLAVDLFEKALSADDDDVAGRPSLAEGLARSYAALGQMARSIAILERCVEASEDDPVQYIRFAGLLGAALTDNGSFAEAERVLAHAISRGREVQDPYTRARLYWSESRLHLEQGQTELAARYARRTLEILRATEDGYAIAHALQSLAHVYLDLGRSEDALELLEEGATLIRAAGTPVEIAQYRIDEARALAATGRSEEAAATAMAAAVELRGAEGVDLGRSYAVLGDIFDDLGQTARAREVLELAIDLLEEEPPSRYLVQAYKRLSALLKARGDVEGALEVLERALGVQEKAGRPLV
jgi:tetratricopeptide (TPR) repeat protein